MQNVAGPTLVAMTTKFRLDAEIQSPTGLYFGLFVCLSVRRITEKAVNGFLTKFLGRGVGMAQGPMSSILVTIRITVRI